ncbi:DUF2240 family protein [Haloparvum alkalitolerans]|uniref:DUF2240 family protein n=1 Tax=Haloparvum alkalitolerans TaxID=1042953 RepID=UPI003CEB2354
MSLEAAVAVPFRQSGKDRLGEGEFVVALSLDRDWFSPDQAKRLVDVAQGRGLVAVEDGDLVPQFDPGEASVPENFVPDESILREQSTFERALDAVVAAGIDKQEAVAAINERQRTLAITLEAAAVVYAREHDVDVGALAGTVREELLADGAEASGEVGDEASERADGGTGEGVDDRSEDAGGEAA